VLVAGGVQGGDELGQAPRLVLDGGQELGVARGLLVDDHLEEFRVADRLFVEGGVSEFVGEYGVVLLRLIACRNSC